jgi:hypothetical protein
MAGMKIVLAILASSVAIAFAAHQGQASCADKPKTAVKGDACCKDKAAPKTAAQKEKEFLAEAQRMTMAAEGKEACCKSAPEKAVAKSDPGCCNAKTEAAKFKVFVAGEGYKFFGCEGSAKKGRASLVAQGKRAGSIQKVTSKTLIG